MIRTTIDDLLRIAPKASPAIVEPFARHCDAILQAHGINSDLSSLSHFWAQAAHETDGFKTLHEYASGEAYEGRRDLGNVRPGDGRRFKGRGAFQLTGRDNYRRYGRLLGLDLEARPELAADPANALKIAALYWSSRSLNDAARRDDLEAVTRAINGGLNGLADRKMRLARAKATFAGRAPSASRPSWPPKVEGRLRLWVAVGFAAAIVLTALLLHALLSG